MATISSLISPLPTTKNFAISTTAQLRPTTTAHLVKQAAPFSLLPKFPKLQHTSVVSTPRSDRPGRLFAAATSSQASVAARRLYVGNIPRNVTSEELQKIIEEHGAVEEAEVMYDNYSKRSRRFAFVTMKTLDDATAAIEKLNGTEIGGRQIKVNITEKPIVQVDLSMLQAEESKFIESPYKVYVGNLAKTVNEDILKKHFSKKGKILGVKVSRNPGTSKSSGFGFVTFSSEKDVEAAISSFNNSLLEGKEIRVNKA